MRDPILIRSESQKDNPFPENNLERFLLRLREMDRNPP
jgi:hypothetical protein